jgi:hypothetical protein
MGEKNFDEQDSPTYGGRVLSEGTTRVSLATEKKRVRDVIVT